MDFGQISIEKHKELKGKMEIISKFPLETREDLSVAYTPGVAAVCRLIVENRENVFTHTIKANTIAVISDGTAVLGLGDIGPEAAMPVMEGKAILFKKFGGVDAFPICLATKDAEEIIKTVKLLAPGFGGINLEDVSAPRCFVIEKRLKEELDIPVFHDDQHGTAIVVLAALKNALKVVGKNLENIKIVINGAGAAATAVFNILMRAGAKGENVIMCDSKGAIFEGRRDLNEFKIQIALKTNPGRVVTFQEAVRGADVFIGLSVAGVLKPEYVAEMAEKPVVFAMANPNPEISFEDAQKTKIVVFGTGRSDYPNQINNVLAFPGIFRGALDARAKQITEDMKLAAAEAISSLVSESELSKDYIIPNPLDPRVASAVADAVKKCAITA